MIMQARFVLYKKTFNVINLGLLHLFFEEGPEKVRTTLKNQCSDIIIMTHTFATHI